MWLQVDQFFAENPDLRLYLYGGKPLDGLKGEEKQKAESATEMFLDCMASSFHQLEHFDEEDRLAAAAYRNFLKERYKTQPALRYFINKHGHWYPQKFVTLLSEETKPANESPSA